MKPSTKETRFLKKIIETSDQKEYFDGVLKILNQSELKNVKTNILNYVIHNAKLIEQPSFELAIKLNMNLQTIPEEIQMRSHFLYLLPDLMEQYKDRIYILLKCLTQNSYYASTFTNYLIKNRSFKELQNTLNYVNKYSSNVSACKYGDVATTIEIIKKQMDNSKKLSKKAFESAKTQVDSSNTVSNLRNVVHTYSQKITEPYTLRLLWDYADNKKKQLHRALNAKVRKDISHAPNEAQVNEIVNFAQDTLHESYLNDINALASDRKAWIKYYNPATERIKNASTIQEVDDITKETIQLFQKVEFNKRKPREEREKANRNVINKFKDLASKKKDVIFYKQQRQKEARQELARIKLAAQKQRQAQRQKEARQESARIKAEKEAHEAARKQKLTKKASRKLDLKKIFAEPKLKQHSGGQQLSKLSKTTTESSLPTKKITGNGQMAFQRPPKQTMIQTPRKTQPIQIPKQTPRKTQLIQKQQYISPKPSKSRLSAKPKTYSKQKTQQLLPIRTLKQKTDIQSIKKQIQQAVSRSSSSVTRQRRQPGEPRQKTDIQTIKKQIQQQKQKTNLNVKNNIKSQIEQLLQTKNFKDFLGGLKYLVGEYQKVKSQNNIKNELLKDIESYGKNTNEGTLRKDILKSIINGKNPDLIQCLSQDSILNDETAKILKKYLLTKKKLHPIIYRNLAKNKQRLTYRDFTKTALLKAYSDGSSCHEKVKNDEMKKLFPGYQDHHIKQRKQKRSPSRGWWNRLWWGMNG